MFSGFGVFQDIVRQKSLPEEYEDWIDGDKLHQALSQYRKAASCTYSKEDEKRDAFIEYINKLYSSLMGRQDRTVQPAIVAGQSGTNGHILGPHGAIYFIQELKLELGSGALSSNTLRLRVSYIQCHALSFKEFAFPLCIHSSAGSPNSTPGLRIETAVPRRMISNAAAFEITLKIPGPDEKFNT
jgi:hypothetical protein